MQVQTAHFGGNSGQSSPSSGGAFKIAQFRPALIPSPLPEDTRFVGDHEMVLLDPHRHDDEYVLATGDDTLRAENTETLSPRVSTASNEAKIQMAGPRRLLFFNPADTIAAITTCGGVCPGLNNVIRALVNILSYRYGVKSILGLRYGFEGVAGLKTEPIKLTPELVKDIHQFGGTMLGTSRGPQNPAKMAEYLRAQNIRILFCIGGDGTQKGAHAIAQYLQSIAASESFPPISVIGIGKTIDNDLLYLDRSFGFETAVELSQQAIVAAHEEARSARNGIGIVKLMGRESGAIALNASLANGDVNMVLLPEFNFSIDDIAQYLVERFKTRDHCVIVVAEGAGQNLLQASGKKDASGNTVLSDIGEFLKKEIGARLKALNLEHSIKYIDPSYAIRGGAANASDSILCAVYAQMAAHAGMAGKSDMMIGLLHGKFVHLPLAKVTEGKKNVDIKGIVYQAFLDATGSPFTSQ